jgi:predicted nucleic acid-binding protein
MRRLMIVTWRKSPEEDSTLRLIGIASGGPARCRREPRQIPCPRGAGHAAGLSRDLFVDASGWIALGHTSDSHHDAAVGAYPLFLRQFRELVTTTLVVAEAYTTLRMNTRSFDATQFLDLLAASTRVIRAPSASAMPTLAVMRARGISEAFAFDKQFAVAGLPAYRRTERR